MIMKSIAKNGDVVDNDNGDGDKDLVHSVNPFLLKYQSHLRKYLW